VIRKATIARWLRTLSTMFAAGVPLVEALDSVGGASGNNVYLMATRKIQQEVSTGTSLTVAMQNANVFPNMVLQMAAIGEESGSLDSMLASPPTSSSARSTRRSPACRACSSRSSWCSWAC
jgi:type IV pilus assembly protein PilC